MKVPQTFYSKDADFNDGESIPLELGKRIRLRCNFRGNPDPDVVWYKNEKRINPQETKDGHGRNRLKIYFKR